MNKNVEDEGDRIVALRVRDRVGVNIRRLDEALDKFNNLLWAHKEHQITQELCDVVTHPNSFPIPLSDIPRQFRTRDLCMRSLKKHPGNYEDVPEEYMDREMWAHIFKIDGMLINKEDIPAEMITQEMYEIAVIHGRLRLQHVPCNFRNATICLYTFRNQSVDSYDIGHYVPDCVKYNKTLHYDLVSARGDFLQYIPDEDKTVDVCKAAIKQNQLSALYLPVNREDLIPAIISLIKGKGGDEVFIYIPNCYRTREVCEVAVSKNGSLLDIVPVEFLDKEMCDIAIANDPNEAKYISMDSGGNISYNLTAKQRNYYWHHSTAEFQSSGEFY